MNSKLTSTARLSFALMTAASVTLAAGCAGDSEAEDSTFEGTLRVMVDGDEPRYDLVLATGERHRLVAPEGSDALAVLENLRSGRKLTIVGDLVEGGLEVDTVVFPDFGTSEEAISTLGPRSLLVLVAKFGDKTNTPVAEVESQIFTGAKSAKKYIEEGSYGKTTLTGQVSGPYLLSGSTTTCNDSAWINEAMTKAKQQGINVDSFNHVMLYMPATACPYAGLGELPGRLTWINGNFGENALFVSSHELGHNFGLHHASSRSCKTDGVPTSLGGTCTNDEYGDTVDAMGNRFTGHFSAYNKERLGWLGAQNIKVASAPGTYTLSPVETASTGVQSLRVPRTDGTFYAIELRKAVGFDATLPTSRRGVVVRISSAPSSFDKTQLLDMTPDAAGMDTPLLGAGKLFSAKNSDFNIQVLSVSADSAKIEVTAKNGAPPPPSGTSFDGKILRLTAVHSGKVMDVSQVSTEAGAKIWQWGWSNTKNQKWAWKKLDATSYQIAATHSNMCLDVPGGSLENSAVLTQWPCHGGANQRFVVEDAGSGAIRIRNVQSGKCLDVKSLSQANGGVIQQYDCSAGANQKWTPQVVTP